MGNIAIVDIDGCLCESIYTNIKHNDNAQLLSDEFEKALEEVTPFEWAKKFDWSQYEHVHVITGRMTEHHDVTMRWLQANFPWTNVTVEHTSWDDSYATRAESYADYVKRKADKIIDVFDETFCCDLVDVFEDDTRVMERIINETTGIDSFNRYFLVAGGLLFSEDKNGGRS